MFQHHSSIARLIILTIILVGVALTAYGFYTLIEHQYDPQHDPLAWRYGLLMPALFVALTLLIAMVGLWQGPDRALLVSGGGILILLGQTVPAAVVGLIALSTFLLGRMVLQFRSRDLSDYILAGAVVFGSVFGLLAPLPINSRGTWGVLLLIPLILGRKALSIEALWSRDFTLKPFGHLYLLKCGIGALTIIHILVGLMPEVGHDALSMHLLVPAYVAHHHLWDYNVKLYSWAVMPKLVNWLYTAAYFFGGETAARLLNVGSVILLAVLVRRLSRWAGASELGSNWGMLIFLATPLTYLETSSLFVEGLWSALLVGGTIAVLQFLTDSKDRKSDLVVIAIMLGGAMSAKAVTYTHLPVLALLLLLRPRRWFNTDYSWPVLKSTLIFFLLSAVPYAVAYRLTGNPLFPFFNGYFKSPLYPNVDFEPPPMFDRGFTFDTLYRMSFEANRFLEGAVGSAGFQWLLVIIPGMLLALIFWERRLLVIGFTCFGWMLLTFWQTAYLRYVFPSFAVASVVIAVMVTVSKKLGHLVWFSSILVLCATLALNIVHFQAATYYGLIDLRVIASDQSRDEYLRRAHPLRMVVRLVNELNQKAEPVIFFSAPLTAGLKSAALCVNWHNPRLAELIYSATGPEDFNQIFIRENVRYVVVHDRYRTPFLTAAIDRYCSLVAKIGELGVYSFSGAK